MSDKGKCSIEECPEDAHTKGWCRTHYLRWYRQGDPLILKPKGNFRRRPESESSTRQKARERNNAGQRAQWILRRAHEAQFRDLQAIEQSLGKEGQRAVNAALRELKHSRPDEYRSYYLTELEKERSVSVDS